MRSAASSVQLTVEADSEGHDKALAWARESFAGELVWAIEDCRHLSARLERDLLTGGRAGGAGAAEADGAGAGRRADPGKSDPIDALAVARAVLREPDLPVASHDAVSRELKLLVDRREDLVGERTRMINRLRWHLHELDPHLDPSEAASLDLAKHQRLRWLSGWPASTGLGRRAGPRHLGRHRPDHARSSTHLERGSAIGSRSRPQACSACPAAGH